MDQALLLEGSSPGKSGRTGAGCKRYTTVWSSTLRRKMKRCANFAGMGEGLMKNYGGLSGAFGLPDIDLFGVPVTDVVVDGATLAGSAILVTQINNYLTPMLKFGETAGYTRDLLDILVGVAAGAAIAQLMGDRAMARNVATGPAMLAMVRILGRVSGQAALAGQLGLVTVESKDRLGLVATEELEYSLTAPPARIPGLMGAYAFGR